MTDKEPAIKPWGGRFSEPTDAFVERFTASVEFDQRIITEEAEGWITIHPTYEPAYSAPRLFFVFRV